MSNPAQTSATLVIERVFPHPPEKLWRALTESRLLAEWLLNNDFELTAGRKFQFRREPMPHWNGVIDCKVLVVEPLKRLSYRWGAMGLETVVEWTLTPAEGRHASAHGAIRLCFRAGPRLQGRKIRLAEFPEWPGAGARRFLT